MADISVPQTIADRLYDVERRLSAMERSPQLGTSSIKGGRLRVLRASGAPVAAFGEDSTNTVGSVLYDSSGNVIAAFGQVPALTGADGVQLGATADPTLLWNATDGQLRPHQISVFSPANNAVVITSGAFTLAHDCWFERAQTMYLHTRFDVGVDAGCSAEVRLVHFGGSTTNVLSLSSVPGQIFNVQLAWVPSSLALNATARFRLEARRTAGAGTINVYPPFGAELGDFRSTATSGGAWTAV